MIRKYPITKNENITSEVIGVLELKEQYAELLDKILVDFNISYEKNGEDKKLINVSLIRTPLKGERL